MKSFTWRRLQNFPILTRRCHFIQYAWYSQVRKECSESIFSNWLLRFHEAGIKGHQAESSLKWLGQHVADIKTEFRWRGENVSWKTVLQSNASAMKLFNEFCERRENREPLQYIIGNWDFRFINLNMRKPVFIPRPETEELVDLVKDWITSKNYNRDVNILEIGTGTGAISLSLLDELKNIRCTAIDQAQHAVNLCQENAARLGLESRLAVHCCTFKDYLNTGLKDFDVLVSNPPYVPEHEVINLQEEVRHEDSRALDGGKDGLGLIIEILQNSEQLLASDGSVWLEVDEEHPEILDKGSILSQSNLEYVEWYKDTKKRPRFCHFKMATK